MGDRSISGLVGGDDALVGALSDNSSSERCDESVELAVFGTISGALYDSILVVWINSTGAEILWRMEPTLPLVVLLRCGVVLPSASMRLCLTRRVVNALVIAIVVVSLVRTDSSVSLKGGKLL